MKTSELTPKQGSSVPCPTCGVTIGKRCVLHSGALRSEMQADAAIGRDIAISGVPKTLEPILPVLLTELQWKDKRTKLTAKRQWLFEQFEVTPTNIRLGHEIKGLDDQIAECTENMRLGR